MGALAKTIERLIDRLITAEHARDAAITQRDAARDGCDAAQDEIVRLTSVCCEYLDDSVTAETRAAHVADRLRRVIAIARAIRSERDQAIVAADLYEEQRDDERYGRLMMIGRVVLRDRIRLRTLRQAQRYRRQIARLRESLGAQNAEIEQHQQERWAAIDTAAALAACERERDALRAEIAALRAATPAVPLTPEEVDAIAAVAEEHRATGDDGDGASDWRDE